MRLLRQKIFFSVMDDAKRAGELAQAYHPAQIKFENLVQSGAGYEKLAEAGQEAEKAAKAKELAEKKHNMRQLAKESHVDPLANREKGFYNTKHGGTANNLRFGNMSNNGDYIFDRKTIGNGHQMVTDSPIGQKIEQMKKNYAAGKGGFYGKYEKEAGSSIGQKVSGFFKGLAKFR